MQFYFTNFSIFPSNVEKFVSLSQLEICAVNKLPIKGLRYLIIDEKSNSTYIYHFLWGLNLVFFGGLI